MPIEKKRKVCLDLPNKIFTENEGAIIKRNFNIGIYILTEQALKENILTAFENITTE